MSGVTLSPSDATPIVILAVIVLILVRRVVGMVRGTPVRPAQMFAFTAFLAALFAFTLLLSLSELPLWTYAVDAAVLVLASIGATRWVRRRVVIEWKAGVWVYRLGPLIPAVYLVLFVTRLALDLLVLGVSPFGGSPPTTAPLSGLPLLVVATVDALFAFSTGLLVGRSTGVYVEYRKRVAMGPPSSSGTPGSPLG